MDMVKLIPTKLDLPANLERPRCLYLEAVQSCFQQGQQIMKICMIRVIPLPGSQDYLKPSNELSQPFTQQAQTSI